MIDLGRIQLAVPPRCGTTWALHAAHAAGLGTHTKTTAHIPFDHQGRTSRQLQVTIVRHPADWLASFWTAIYTGKIGVPCVDRFSDVAIESKDFTGFILNYVEKCPGTVGSMFEAYRANTYLRLEDMPWAWIDMLRSVGVSKGAAEQVRKIGRINQSTGKPVVTKMLREVITRSEQVMMDAFDYPV